MKKMLTTSKLPKTIKQYIFIDLQLESLRHVVGFYLTLKHQPHKMVKHTQPILRQTAD